MNLSDAAMNRSDGEATVAEIGYEGRVAIAVGILKTKKIIAICGYMDSNSEDIEESRANAVIIAAQWNLFNRTAAGQRNKQGSGFNSDAYQWRSDSKLNQWKDA